MGLQSQGQSSKDQQPLIRLKSFFIHLATYFMPFVMGWSVPPETPMLKLYPLPNGSSECDLGWRQALNGVIKVKWSQMGGAHLEISGCGQTLQHLGPLLLKLQTIITRTSTHNLFAICEKLIGLVGTTFRLLEKNLCSLVTNLCVFPWPKNWHIIWKNLSEIFRTSCLKKKFSHARKFLMEPI